MTVKEAMELCGPIPVDDGPYQRYIRSVAAASGVSEEDARTVVSAVLSARMPASGVTSSGYMVDIVDRPVVNVKNSHIRVDDYPVMSGAAGLAIFAALASN
jgi:hypothetical protein